MRIYLDNCCLQRPCDDQSQPRIRVETEAVIAILAAAEAGDLSLVASEALEYEIGRTTDPHRRDEALAALRLATERLALNDKTEALAASFEATGMPPMDALHLAVASLAQVDYLVTCDDRFLKKSRNLAGLACKVISPLTFVLEKMP